MGRRRGGGFGGGKRGGGGLFGGFGKKKKKAPPPPKRAAPPPPAQRPAAPAPAQQQGGGGLMGMVAQGMAFGTGSAIAHQAVGAVARGVSGSGGGGSEESAGSSAGQQSQNQGQQLQGVCALDQKGLYSCLQENSGNAAACQYYFDALKQCQENAQYQQQYQ